MYPTSCLHDSLPRARIWQSGILGSGSSVSADELLFDREFNTAYIRGHVSLTWQKFGGYGILRSTLDYDHWMGLPSHRLMIGSRKSVPNARRLTATTGGAWTRLNVDLVNRR